MKEYLHVDILQGTSNYSTRSNCSLTWYFLSWARNTGFLMHNTALCGRHCADAVDVAIVQSLSHVQLLATPLAEACQASLPFTISWSLLKFMLFVGDAISQPSHPLSPPSSPAFNLSQLQGLFQWVGSSHQVAKYYSFSFSISPFKEYSEWKRLPLFLFCIIPNLLHTTLNWKHLIMIPLSKQLFFRLSFLSSLPGPHFRLYHLLAGRPNHH